MDALAGRAMQEEVAGHMNAQNISNIAQGALFRSGFLLHVALVDSAMFVTFARKTPLLCLLTIRTSESRHYY